MAFGTRRTGLPSMRALAVILCRLVAQFTPVITKLYPDNALLLAALVAANAACGELVTQIDATLEPGV
jgi:hypothetical protein